MDEGTSIRPTRLGQLAAPARRVSGALTLQELERLFGAEPALDSVVVERVRGCFVLRRDEFVSQYAGRLGLARRIKRRRSVESLTGPPPALVLGAEMTLIEAGRAAMARAEEHRYEDVVVTGGSEAVGIVSFGRLLAELSELHADRAQHDPLTGLPNRSLLFENLARALRSRDARRPCLLFIDIDDFKQVNDSLGHLTGDELLIAIADRLRGAFRDCDLVARIGGDEFVILLSVEDDAGARAAADRVLLALSAPLEAAERSFAVVASVGVAVRTDETRPEQMLRAGDLAMYEAKGAGKGRVGVYRPELHSAAVERLELRNALPIAIAERQLDVAFQPIVGLDSGALHGVETLARWEHPERGFVSPIDFIQLAEETGAIADIGEFVLREGLGRLHEWTPELPWLRMGINVSLRELERPGYPALVEGILADNEIDPQRLILEVTETAFGRDDAATMRTLHELKELGVGLAIDDFGTGFSSLARLGELPVDVIKLDKRFVDQLARNADRRLLQGLLGLAREMSIDVVAEGIEEPSQLEMLCSMQCRLGQGYLISRPMPGDSLPAWAEIRPVPARA